jgi:hypothetical protein
MARRTARRMASVAAGLDSAIMSPCRHSIAIPKSD